MSPGSNSTNVPVETFRGVSGNLISLDETIDCSQYPNNLGVIKFVLRNTRQFPFAFNIILALFAVIVCAVINNPSVPVGVYLIYLLLQCKCFVSSVNVDTLLVVESVGIQIIGKRVFSSQESSTFLPWNTVQDVFINEVITGHRVLYYLTFLVREYVGGKETTKLVPLFHEIKPERKCLEYINSDGFSYPKELTKVIRRIIKSQPRQGQQFGTRHLLVTYNHSPWMRQDKMFALLKFRGRTDATAFPHAFVLTVQTLNDSSSEQLYQENRAKTSAVANLESPVDGFESLKEEAREGTFQDGSSSHRSYDYEVADAKKGTLEGFDKNSIRVKSSGQTGASSMRETERDRKKDRGKRRRSVKKSLDKSELSPRMKTRNQRGSSSLEKVAKSREDDHELPGDSPAEKGMAADFADLPYQYIIEKEIEDSKGAPKEECANANERESSPGPSHRESDSPGKSLPRSPRAAQAETARSADITDLVMEGLMFTIRQDQDTVTVVEQKTKLEMDEVLVNSEKAETKEGEKCLLNSSLLRLENLITKIEMSEARSKSKEDAGASAGAKKTVPQISSTHDSPRKVMSTQYGICGTRYEAQSGTLEFPRVSGASPRPAGPGDHSPIADVSKCPLVKINLNNVRDVLSHRLHYVYSGKPLERSDAGDIAKEVDSGTAANEKEETNVWKIEEHGPAAIAEEDEEEEVGLELKYEEKDGCEFDDEADERDEEIIPEALQPKTIPDFLTDEFPAKVAPNIDTIATASQDLSATVKSGPRVISNEIVTVDQIPPAMQKALSFKRLKRMRLSNDSTSTVQDVAGTEKHMETDDFLPKMKLTPLLERSNEKNETVEESSDPSPSPTIDITARSNRHSASEKSRKLPVRRRSLRRVEQGSTNTNGALVAEPEIRFDMWKLMEDMTRGAKVVVRRLDLANIPNGVRSDSFLSKYNENQRSIAESS